MDNARFSKSESGSLVPTEQGHLAFVPNPLPPGSLNLEPVLALLADVSQSLGELNGIARTLRDPFLLIRPLQAREAITSSSMEGTYATVDDLMIADAGYENATSSTDTREVNNYRRALSQAIESLDELPLSLRTLRDAHRRLLSGVTRHRGAHVAGGEFKRSQNFIGAYELGNARFVPPPPGRTLECLDALEKYIHRDSQGDLPVLVEAALIHYQFETIHPFGDGNGRVGRMLIILHLFARKALRQPILYLSPEFERRKDEYIDRMFAVSADGDWLGWIRFFLEIVQQSCASTIEIADKLLALEKSYRARLPKAGKSANLGRIVDDLFRRPVQSIPMIAEMLGVTYRAAQLNVEALVNAGLLAEIPDIANPRYFAAREILDIIRGS